MLTQDQREEFAERGYVVIRGVVAPDLIATANRRIDSIVATDPPAEGTVGQHFYFPAAQDEPDLLAPLTGSPAFATARELASGMVEPPQVQIALNIPPFPHRPGGPHIDAAISEPTPGFVPSTFTMLAGIFLTDQLSENSGNLWAWPGTHLRHAEYFRERGVEMYCAYPAIEWPEPVQVTGRAGDLLLAHYLLGHNIGGNYESDTVRRMLYYRLSDANHFADPAAILTDLWGAYDGITSRPAAPRPAPDAAGTSR